VSPPLVRRGSGGRSLAQLPPRLRLHVERHRRSRAHGFEAAPQRRHEIAGALDLLAAATAGLDHLLVVGRGLELGERHHVRLGGVTIGEDVEGGLPHRQPGLVVGNDGERRQVLGARDVMIRNRVAEHVRAVADGDDHLALGGRKLGAEPGAEVRPYSSAAW
jgi:hypothetical protein